MCPWCYTPRGSPIARASRRTASRAPGRAYTQTQPAPRRRTRERRGEEAGRTKYAVRMRRCGRAGQPLRGRRSRRHVKALRLWSRWARQGRRARRKVRRQRKEKDALPPATRKRRQTARPQGASRTVHFAARPSLPQRCRPQGRRRALSRSRTRPRTLGTFSRVQDCFTPHTRVGPRSR
jgi:hypothetical protein